MATLTEIVASVVVQSSAMALSHFGVAMQPVQVDKVAPPPAERVIARTHAAVTAPPRVLKTACPDPVRKPQALRT